MAETKDPSMFTTERNGPQSHESALKFIGFHELTLLGYWGNFTVPIFCPLFVCHVPLASFYGEPLS